MNFLAHLIFALVFFTTVLYVVGYLNGLDITDVGKLYKLFVAYIIVLTSAVVPDIDHRKSIIFQVFNLIIGVLLFIWIVSAYGVHVETIGIYLIIYALWYWGVSKLIIPKHRGFLHSLSFLAIFTIVVFCSTRSLLFTGAAFTGFLSHLLLDRCIKLW